MHIGIDLGLKYVNSNRTLSYLPEEKDAYLNKATLQWVNNNFSSKSNPKSESFESIEKRYDNLEELKRTVVLQSYVDTVESDCEYSIFPWDYYLGIKSRSNIQYNCLGVSRSSKTEDKFYAVVKWVIDTTSPYYDGFKIAIDTPSITIFDITNVGGVGYALAYPVTEFGRFVIVNEAIYAINAYFGSTINVYWERYSTMYQPNSFIFVSNSDFGSVTLSYSGVTSNVKSSKLSRTFYDNVGTRKVPNRLYSSEDVYDIIPGTFSKTIYYSPITILENSLIKVFVDSTFVVDNIYLTYIKLPRPINLALQQNCEVNPKFHQEIVDLAVQMMKAVNNEPNYQQIVRENLPNA